MKTKRFLLVDDDPMNNKLCRITIRIALPEVAVVEFTEPEKGLEFLKQRSEIVTILLLDINMPTLTGWEFLEEFETYPEDLRNNVWIYILSSSVDPRDKAKAAANSIVKGYLEKPLNADTIEKLFSEVGYA